MGRFAWRKVLQLLQPLHLQCLLHAQHAATCIEQLVKLKKSLEALDFSKQQELYLQRPEAFQSLHSELDQVGNFMEIALTFPLCDYIHSVALGKLFPLSKGEITQGLQGCSEDTFITQEIELFLISSYL